MSRMFFPSVKGQIGHIMDSVMAAEEIVALPDEKSFSFRLAFEELAVNIINYAYKDDVDGGMKVDISKDDDGLHATITDSGVMFNPLEHEDPDVSLSAEDRDIGGLGIFLVKKLMDDVSYRREGNKNVVTIDFSL